MVGFKQRRSTPLRDKGLDYLQRYVAGLAVPAQGKLAPVRVLARDAGVSVFTVSRLMNMMAAEKKVVIIPGRGIWKVGCEIPNYGCGQLREYQHGLKWERVAQRITRDIHGGRYRHGTELPSLKRMVTTYGASLPTLKKAIAQLVSEQVLSCDNKRYWVRSMVPYLGDSSVVVITAGQDSGRPLFVNERDHDFFWVLERESCNAGLRLCTVTLMPSGKQADSFKKQIAAQAKKHNVIGWLLVAAGLENAHDIALHLGDTGKPVAILDESSRFSVRTVRALSPLVCVFGMENSTLPGRKIGRYLWGLGHRRIGFFSLHPGSNWSELRRSGLHEVAVEAGSPGAVIDFQKPVNVSAGNERLAVPIRRQIDSLVVDGLNIKNDGFQKRLAHHMDLFLYAEIKTDSIKELLVHALHESGTTAWVAENDETAFLLLDFLAQNHVAVPKKVSVIGFDNYMESQLRGMSTYDFNFETAAHSMMAYIINPHARTYTRSSQRIEIEGMIVTRDTTAAPAV